MASLVWFVTGCSSGFGEELVHAILARGDKVIATSRRAEERLQGLKTAGAAILELDVTAEQAQLNSVMDEALKIYGGIDVVVNNAAYIEAGVLEELDNERILRGLRTNFLGPLGITRSILPHFRAKKAGKLIFMSTVGAFYGVVAAGVYSASKGALESVVNCLEEEVSPFGIRCCLVIPGFFRTKIFSPTNFKLEASKHPIPEYEQFNKSIQEMASDLDGNMPGDPKKAMECIVDVVRGEGKAVGKPFPLRLPLGLDGVAIVRGSARKFLKVCDDWEDLSKDMVL